MIARSDNAIDEVRRMAESHGLDFRDCGGGHVQISGNGVLVNYYPASKRRTAYCPETGQRETHCTPYNACAMAMRGKVGGEQTGPPKPAGHKRPRKHGPDPSDIEPKVTNPAGLRHFYDGDLPPWDESLGGFRYLTNADTLRGRALVVEREAIGLRAHADRMEESTT